MSSINWPLVWKTLEYILDNPEEWDQSYFVKKTDCGTTHCFAGVAIMLETDEWEPVFVDHGGYHFAGDYYHQTARVKDHADRLATHLLRLHGYGIHPWALYDADNTLIDIVRVLAQWASWNSEPWPAEILTKLHQTFDEDPSWYLDESLPLGFEEQVVEALEGARA